MQKDRETHAKRSQELQATVYRLREQLHSQGAEVSSLRQRCAGLSTSLSEAKRTAQSSSRNIHRLENELLHLASSSMAKQPPEFSKQQHTDVSTDSATSAARALGGGGGGGHPGNRSVRQESNSSPVGLNHVQGNNTETTADPDNSGIFATLHHHADVPHHAVDSEPPYQRARVDVGASTSLNYEPSMLASVGVAGSSATFSNSETLNSSSATIEGSIQALQERMMRRLQSSFDGTAS